MKIITIYCMDNGLIGEFYTLDPKSGGVPVQLEYIEANAKELISEYKGWDESYVLRQLVIQEERRKARRRLMEKLELTWSE